MQYSMFQSTTTIAATNTHFLSDCSLCCFSSPSPPPPTLSTNDASVTHAHMYTLYDLGSPLMAASIFSLSLFFSGNQRSAVRVFLKHKNKHSAVSITSHFFWGLGRLEFSRPFVAGRQDSLASSAMPQDNVDDIPAIFHMSSAGHNLSTQQDLGPQKALQPCKVRQGEKEIDRKASRQAETERGRRTGRLIERWMGRVEGQRDMTCRGNQTQADGQKKNAP